MFYNRRSTSRRSTIQPSRAPMVPLALLLLLVLIILGNAWWSPTTEALSAQPTAVVELATATPEPPIHIAWLPQGYLDLVFEISTRTAAEPRLRPLAPELQEIMPEVSAIVLNMESHGNPWAVSPSGALGLMQIMPTTAISVASMRNMFYQPQTLMDPKTNIDYGSWSLADEMSFFGLPETADPDWQESVTRVAAAYNGGRWAAYNMDYDTLQIGGNCASTYPRVNEDQMYRYACFVGGIWHERNWETSPTFEVLTRLWTQAN